MIRIGAGNKGRERGPDAVRSRLKLRPRMMELEGRALLSTLTVSNTSDSESGSLRAAIAQANADGGGDTIVFSSLFNSRQTIALSSGELQLTHRGTTTIQGPGANLLTVSGGGTTRVFDVEGSSVALSGMTITGGLAPNDGVVNYGGGVSSHDSSLTLTNVTITGNSSGDSSNSGSGGGLVCSGDSNTSTNTTTLTNCTISGNFGNFFGSGVYNKQYSTLTMTDCTVSNNTGADQGGGLLNEGTATLSGCTISGNSATNTLPSPSQGGGLANDGTMAVTNCTVSGNYAAASGGVTNGGGPNTLTMTNCTVSGNSSSGGISGVVNNATLTMTNTIVSGNKYGDVFGGYTGGNNLIGGTPLLAPLGNYGGPTETMALLPGSPAIGGGASGASIPFIDQRGQPRAGPVDIGAFQSQGFTLTPVAGSAMQSAPIHTQFANPLAVTVKPVNPDEPVDGGVVNFAVTTGSGASAVLSAATATIQGGQASVTATANATPGTDLVTATSAGAAQVGFVLTNTEAPSLRLTTPRDVVNPVDSLTSLREAIAYANSHPGPDTITLDPSVFGSKRETIVLTGGPLVLTDPATTTIIGPGAKRLIISGGGKGRVFDVEGGSLRAGGSDDQRRSGQSRRRHPQRGRHPGAGPRRLERQPRPRRRGVVQRRQGDPDARGPPRQLSTGGRRPVQHPPSDPHPAISRWRPHSVMGRSRRWWERVSRRRRAARRASGQSGSARHSGGDERWRRAGAGPRPPRQPRPQQLRPAQHPQRDLPMATRSGRSPETSSEFPRITGENLMNRIELKSDRGRGCVTRCSRNRRLRPTLMTLEGRTLLSTFTVNSTADDGSAGTLRWAIGQANASNQADTIDFSSLFDTPQTITLSGGSLLLTDTATTTITGPGANLLSVSGGGKSRVFDIDGASAALSGLTITGGSAESGGGLVNAGGTMAVTNCTVSGNAATDQGGGQATQFGGITTLTGCTVSGNTAPAGAGLFNSGGTLSLVDCTVSGNTASGNGGGLYNSGGTAMLTSDTITANTAATDGGIAVGAPPSR